MAGRACLLLALAACGKHDDAPPPAPRPLASRSGGKAAPVGPIAVPSVRAPLPIDGEWEPDWNDRAARVVFHVRGGEGEARPYSEMRLLHDRDALLVGLYAADEDIRSTETFSLSIGALSVKVDATGALTPPVPGAQAAIDLDGTRDHPDDYDEEWKLELSIPIAALGPGPLTLHVERCDTPKDHVERCGAWDGSLAPPAIWPK